MTIRKKQDSQRLLSPEPRDPSYPPCLLWVRAGYGLTGPGRIGQDLEWAEKRRKRRGKSAWETDGTKSKGKKGLT